MSDTIKDDFGPPSEHGTPAFDDDDTRRIVIRLAEAQTKAAGAATAWRSVGAVAVTVGLAIAAGGLAYAQQAAVDHERVDRLGADVARLEAEVAAMTAAVGRIGEDTAAIRGALGVRRGGRHEDEE